MDEKKLELRLGPPGGDDEYSSSAIPALSLGFSCVGAKRGFSATVKPKDEVFKQQQQTEIIKQQCPLPPAKNATAGQRSSQTRMTSAPVVGWPPIRSFRKNLPSSSAKATPESPDGSPENAAKLETSTKRLFVKINMDGIPIGRKVDLKAYDSYDKLSVAVDELFRDLRAAAQRDPIAAGNQRSLQKEQVFTGLLDGSGEFTLVYEDDEGDRMLVGDVPWEMFVSTAKRLRVLKSSELSTLRLGAINKKRTTVGC